MHYAIVFQLIATTHIHALARPTSGVAHPLAEAYGTTKGSTTAQNRTNLFGYLVVLDAKP